uniref:Nonstructural protein 4 n=1 Tax=Alphacoronavirus sp. TaxID=1906673 RepID=A0A8F0ZXT5_9ALPC|nr:nonstructural protein 4 [Alphacoronavirus sp.]QWN56293.1 nonstructural protein 4 [Alphacoronavirus sp.]QWN56304.1 nonstructural protein 4 [Alphacoronavirus sp.]
MCVAGSSVRLGYSYCYNTTVSYTIRTGDSSVSFRASLDNGTSISGKIYLGLSLASAFTTAVPIKQYSWSFLD